MDTFAGCLVLTLTLSILCVNGQNVTLNGVEHANDSVVSIGDIGEGNSALLCLTDSTQCCKGSDNPNGGPLGEWYFPDGTQVEDGVDASRSIFRNRGPSVVRLNRRNNAQSPTGVYRCEIPDASGTNRSVFVELRLISPSSPTNLASPSQSPTSITLSWEQPAGDAVDRYDIVYTYQGACSDYTQPENMATVNNGTAREYTLHNLQEFSDYAITIAAVNDAGRSMQARLTATTQSTSPSGSPQSVSVSSQTLSSITVQWDLISCIDRNSVVTGYRVQYRIDGSTDSYTRDVPGIDNRSLIASGLEPCTRYRFEVAALNSVGSVWEYRSTAAATRDLSLPMLSSLTSLSQSPTSITLSWNQPDGDAVDRYAIVYTYQRGCNRYSQPVAMATETSFTRRYIIQDLQEFSRYTITVTAVNCGGSSVTLTTTATTAHSAPSGPPQFVTMSSVTSSSITVQWRRVSCIDRNSEITGYTVRYGQTGSTTTDMVSGTSDSDRMFTASGLIPRTSYTFEVAAVSNEGTGPFSSRITVTTSAPDEFMFQLDGIFYGNNSVVSLGDIGVGPNDLGEGDSLGLLCLTVGTQCCRDRDNPNGGGLGQWYFPDDSQVPVITEPSSDIYRNRGASVVRLNRRNNAQSPTGVYRCEIPNASGTIQNIFVGGYTNGNQGAPSIQSVQFELTSATDPATPSFTLDCITAGGPVDFNNITWTRDGSSLPANHGLFQVLDDGSTATYSNTLAVTGRETGQYSCQLQHSGSTTFMNITVEAANPPLNLVAVKLTITAVQVSWSAPASGATVTGYVIYYDTTGGSEQSVTVGAAAIEYTLTGLLNGQTYSISIVALSRQLPSILTGPVSVTLTSQAPSSPTNLASPSQSPTSITLSWEQPAGDAVDRYDIVYTYQGACGDYTQPENMATVNDGTAREYTLQNLQELSDYAISVTAVNATGASAPAVIVETTSAKVPSGQPQPLMMSSVTSNSITVQWGRVSCIDRNSEITDYTVCYGQTGSTTTVMASVLGTSDSDRMFSASGLIPNTSYTFEVAAVSNEGTGPFSTGTTVETLAPEVVLFQVRIVGQLDCGAWIVNNNDQKRDDIAQHLVVGVEELCNCGFSRRNITNDGFQCFSANSVHVTYRGTLHGTEQASSLQLAGFIEQWTTGEQVILIQGVIFKVDSSCTVLIESFTDKECTKHISESSNILAIVAGTAIGILIFAIIIILIPVTYLIVRNRTKALQREGAAELKVISTAPCAAYEPTATQGQEYEVVDRRSEPVYEYIQPAATTPLGGGAEYAKVADVK